MSKWYVYVMDDRNLLLGWDMAVEEMQRQKTLPWMFYYPVLSRAKNIGVEGLNKAPDVILYDSVILSKHKYVDWSNYVYREPQHPQKIERQSRC